MLALVHTHRDRLVEWPDDRLRRADRAPSAPRSTPAATRPPPSTGPRGSPGPSMSCVNAADPVRRPHSASQPVPGSDADTLYGG